MSTPTYSAGGAISSLRIEVCVIRWGGGAQAGKYHVFTTGIRWNDVGGNISAHCVVDDFGNLVSVQ